MPQILRLTRQVNNSSRMLAIAVYAEPHNGDFAPVAAASAGYEGVACIDDASRAANLACRLYRQSGALWLRELAVGYLSFICFMQQTDGSIVNFILDWHGTPNMTGPTSAPGGEWWFARGMRALAVGAREAPDICVPALRKGLHRLSSPFDDTRVQSIALLALLAARDILGPSADRACRSASDVLASQIKDARLEHRAWFWGEIQEGALATAAMVLKEPEFGRIAVNSARRRFIDVKRHLRQSGTIVPYDANSIAWSSRKLHELSADRLWLIRSAAAVSWFYGRNSTGEALYDSKRGLIYDGIHDGVMSPNAGAEANIEGAHALLEASYLRAAGGNSWR